MKNTHRGAQSAKKAKSGTQHQSRGHAHDDATIVFHGVASGQLRSTSLLTTLRAVKDGQTAREWLGMTLKDLGEGLAQTDEARRGEPYSKQYISQLEHGHRPWLPDLRAGMCRLITDRVFKLTGETIGISLRINSPWRVRLYRMCETHGRYELQRANQKHCPKCK
jgi:hypothetical protein